jgi:chromosome segregation ATPase
MDEDRIVKLIGEETARLEHRIEHVEQRLETVEKRIEESEQRLARRITESSNSIAKLITDISDSLQKEIRDLHQHRNRMDARLNRHGGELISGARWIARLTEWTQATDDNMMHRDERLADLESRIKKLESDRPAA